MSELKCFVIGHSESDLPVIPSLTGILAGGSSLSALTDGSGDNIANKNPLMNEMTAIYWLWKHYDEIGSPSHILVEQYRRLFLPFGKHNYYESVSLGEREKKAASFEGRTAEDVLKGRDIAAPFPLKCRSVARQYSMAHGESDLRLATEIISELTPEYAEAAENYLGGNACYLYNMFLFDRDTFMRYAEWMFTVLFEFEKRRETSGRFYISERLTGIFFKKLEEEGKTCRHLPVLFVTGKRESLKSCIAKFFAALKEGRGLRAAFRPLVVKLLPKNLWMARKRRIFFSEKELEHIE